MQELCREDGAKHDNASADQPDDRRRYARADQHESAVIDGNVSEISHEGRDDPHSSDANSSEVGNINSKPTAVLHEDAQAQMPSEEQRQQRAQTPVDEMATQQMPVRNISRSKSFPSHAHATKTPSVNTVAAQHNLVWEGPRFPSFPSSLGEYSSTNGKSKARVRHAKTASLKTIRLLRLVTPTARGGETLRYSLKEFEYVSCPEYISLSYVWGDETPTSMIHVNGESVPVRANLHLALSSILESDPDAYVWADAICINQRDDKEKSKVVQHMDDIFANAKLVYAWLGPIEKATEHSSTADLFAHLWHLGALFWEHAGTEGPRKLNERQLDLELILAKTLDALLGLFARPEGGEGFPVEEYAAFSARAFWSRIWVLQEVYLAKNLYYICGHCRLPSQTVAGALILLETFQRHLMHSQGPVREEIETSEQLAKFAFGFPSFPEMHRLIIYTSIYPFDVVSLRIAMTNFCVKELPTGSRATDARDMIYGLIGFANEEEKTYIQADYSISVQETYTITTRRMIENGFTDILAWAQPETKGIANLPSWVPDYSSTIYESMCSQGQAKPWLPQFNASGETDYNDETPPPCVDDLTLPVHGRRLGYIVRVGEALIPRCEAAANDREKSLLTRSAQHEDLLSFLTEIRNLVKHAGETRHCDSVTDAEWRIPCCDQIVIDGKLIRQDPSTQSRHEATINGLQECISSADHELPPHSRPYVEALLRWADKRPFATADGFVGLGPADARVGDVAVVPDGFNGCYVLREKGGRRRRKRRKRRGESTERKNEYHLVGEAYVDGAMDGEMSGGSEVGSREWFLLV